MGTDITAGNLTAAQADHTTLSQSGPLASKNSSNALVQDSQAVGKAPQGGDIAGAQTALATFQTAATAAQAAGQAAQSAQAGLAGAAVHNSHYQGGHAHIGPANSGAQQADPLAQAFTTLEQALQANNLSRAQSAFATIQADLQKSGFSFGSTSSSGTGTTTAAAATTAAAGGLNVTA